MAIDTAAIAEILRPGLRSVFDDAFNEQSLQQWRDVFEAADKDAPLESAVDDVDLPLPVLAVAAAAVVVKENPVVPRRRLFAWFGGG